MKLLTLLTAALFLMTAMPAMAATPITKDQANAYYANCKLKQDPRMSAETQDAMCACTSVEMMKSMSVEDIQVMKGNTQDSRHALNKMFLEVYTPCMRYPIQDLINGECLSDPKVSAIGSKTPKAEICGCMAENTADWFEVTGKNLMAKIIAANPNVYDPIGPVMESKEFKQQSYQSMLGCLNGRK